MNCCESVMKQVKQTQRQLQDDNCITVRTFEIPHILFSNNIMKY